MIRSASIFLLLFIFTAFRSGDNTEWIAWNHTQTLSWDDFRGTPDAGNDHDAQSQCVLDASLEGSANDMTIRVSAYFIPGRSWTRVKSDFQLLRHEQLHFDITELHARALRKRLSQAFRKNQNPEAIFEESFHELQGEMHAMQERYDLETGHGTDHRAQKAWEMKIDTLLEELGAYDNSEIRFILQ